MRTKIGFFGLLVLVALVVSACGADADDMMDKEAPPATTEKVDSDTMAAQDGSASTTETDHGEDTMTEDDSEAMGGGSMDTMESETTIDLPAWFSAELSDVNSGATLTVADLFKDQVILVETMAIWCSNCLRQQQEVRALHEALGERDELVTLVLDVDANEDAGNLRTYAEKHDFTWLYAVAPREVAREIGQLYGDQFLNPPSTPMLIVDRQGEVHLLPFGHKTAEDLQEALAPFLDGEM